jgi:histidine triad (HIT) family protein
VTADCLFCRIVNSDEPSDRIAASEHVVAFRDKFPRAPVHVLIATRKHFPSAHALRDEHAVLLADAFALARRVADAEGIANGYRIATNIGSQGGQAIQHLHFHVLGGKQLGFVDGANE